jgi:hypothetical protein
MHQIAHTLGFYHEQSRHDRDQYVEVLKANVASLKEVNFEKYTESKVDVFELPYDLSSDMHYGNTVCGCLLHVIIS